jgi:hypothetical protein
MGQDLPCKQAFGSSSLPVSTIFLVIRRPNQIKYLNGQRFGRLIALQRLDTGRYECICDCGKMHEVSRENLTTLNVKSCGCLKVETIRRLRAKPNSRELAIARYYRRNAKVSNRVWALDQVMVETLLHAPCYYCGRDDALGIDRVDSTGGYTQDNVVSCCVTCNRAKLVMSQSEFYDWIERVYHYTRRRKGASDV